MSINIKETFYKKAKWYNKIDMFGIGIHKRIECGEIDLVIASIERAARYNDGVKTIFYDIYLHDTNQKIGRCDLRIGMNEELYYAGNIGYRIFEDYRGHHYAYQACLKLFEIAKDEYEMDRLLITCSPGNIASIKTCERLNGKLIGDEDVPKYHWLYKRGETHKLIYEYSLI